MSRDLTSGLSAPKTVQVRPPAHGDPWRHGIGGLAGCRAPCGGDGEEGVGEKVWERKGNEVQVGRRTSEPQIPYPFEGSRETRPLKKT